MKRFILFFLLLSAFVNVQAQVNSSSDILEQQYLLESLKNGALDAMSRGNFTEALEILDRAIVMAPEDQDLKDMRISLRELQILKEDTSVLPDVKTSKPRFYDLPAVRDEEEEIVESPDFAGELFSGSQFINPFEYREAFIGALGGHFGRSRPVYLENDMFYQHDAAADMEQTYGLYGDLQYYFRGLERAMGVNMRYYGNILNPENADILLQQMDLGIMLRGFFQESVNARSVLGFRFGVSLLYLNEYTQSEKQPALANALTFGAFYSDALLRHLFRKNRFFEKLVLDIGTDYYFLTMTEQSNMIRYNGVFSYQITPEFRLGLAGRLLSTSQDLQVLSAWNAGLQLTYTR